MINILYFLVGVLAISIIYLIIFAIGKIFGTENQFRYGNEFEVGIDIILMYCLGIFLISIPCVFIYLIGKYIVSLL